MSEAATGSRKRFLKRGAVDLAAAGGLSVARGAHAAGDDTIRVALVGCGGRGTGAAANCLNVRGQVKLVAVADVFEERARGAQASLKNQYGDKVDIPADRVFVGFDAYQKAVACGADLVILATPPGFRPAQYKAAVEAGRHVFMEKPCCVDAPGFRVLAEANQVAERKGLKIGVGLQRRHEPSYVETVKRIHDNALGDLLLLRVYWNMGNLWTKGRRPGDTEMMYQLRNWQYFVSFGGDHIVEQHVHNLDIANWIMAKEGDPQKAHPTEASGSGGRQRRDEFPDTGHVYDHHFVEFTYADGVKLLSQCRQMPGCWGAVGEMACGRTGVCNGAGTIRGPNAWNYNGPRANPYDQEHVDLIRAIRQGEKHHEGWHGAASSMTAVLGRMATYSGQVVRWDDAVAKGPSLLPEKLTWDAKPPILPDAKGSYRHAVAVPGVYKPY